MNEPQTIYDLWPIVLPVVYIFFAWATFSAARHHLNTDNRSFFAGIFWPTVWIFLAIRGWDSYFLESLKSEEEPVKPIRINRVDLFSGKSTPLLEEHETNI